MTDDRHAERREPQQPEGAFDLVQAGEDLMAQARELAAGRAARTLTPGAGAPLKQTMLALLEGQRMDEHQAPGPATLQVLRGDVTVHSDNSEMSVRENHWAVIPREMHTVTAATDALLLLTVVMPRRDAD